MATTALPDQQTVNLPEDEYLTIVTVPTASDGKPSELDSAPTWVTSANAKLLAVGDPHSQTTADGLTQTVANNGGASGDQIVTTQTLISEVDTFTVNYNTTLASGELATVGMTSSISKT